MVMVHSEDNYSLHIHLWIIELNQYIALIHLPIDKQGQVYYHISKSLGQNECASQFLLPSPRQYGNQFNMQVSNMFNFGEFTAKSVISVMQLQCEQDNTILCNTEDFRSYECQCSQMAKRFTSTCRGILLTVCGAKNVKHSELAKTYTVCMT